MTVAQAQQAGPASLAAPVLAAAIMLWGLSFMLRLAFGDGLARRPYAPVGSGFAGRLFLGLLFSVLLPVIWWTLAAGGRLYHRGFVVFTEFLTGVHDWGTYRTSVFKFAGALFAWLAFNGVLFLFLSLLTWSSSGAPLSFWGWGLAGIATAGCGGAARVTMRRMP